jgi:hypothetical protein
LISRKRACLHILEAALTGLYLRERAAEQSLRASLPSTNYALGSFAQYSLLALWTKIIIFVSGDNQFEQIIDLSVKDSHLPVIEV